MAYLLDAKGFIQAKNLHYGSSLTADGSPIEGPNLPARPPAATGERSSVGPVARSIETDELTDDEVMVRLQEAARDEREGRLVRCETEEDLRTVFARLRSGRE